MEDDNAASVTIDAEKNWTLGVTALASFMMALDALIMTTAFATIRADFNATVETLQWAVNAYNLSFAVLLLTGAALGDRFGRRRHVRRGHRLVHPRLHGLRAVRRRRRR